MEGTALTNLRWYQKTRVIARSCDIKISAVCSFVSSQCTRVTDRQNYYTQDRASIYASRGKNQENATIKHENKYSLGL